LLDPRLNHLYQALTHKADAVQHEFGAVGDALQALGRKLVSTPRGDTGPLREEQATLRERQLALAAEINIWRDRARAVLRQRDEAALQAYMDELAAAGDEGVAAAVAATRAADAFAVAHPEQAAALNQPQSATNNPAARLLVRARTEHDLRGDDPSARQREAVEYANRTGLAQNDEALASLEAALADPDPFVSDVAALTLIQVHRFRALRLGDLEVAHLSVRWLARSKHRAAIPVLVEILESSRSGYVPGHGGLVEGNNRRSRLVALASLVDWRTPAAQSAIRARLRDRDSQMVAAADRALVLFPGDWL
jgi:hypothetical protein